MSLLLGLMGSGAAARTRHAARLGAAAWGAAAARSGRSTAADAPLASCSGRSSAGSSGSAWAPARGMSSFTGVSPTKLDEARCLRGPCRAAAQRRTFALSAPAPPPTRDQSAARRAPPRPCR